VHRARRRQVRARERERERERDVGSGRPHLLAAASASVAFDGPYWFQVKREPLARELARPKRTWLSVHWPRDFFSFLGHVHRMMN
jgi:hypothetical protein